jgi:hypothetical protein
LGSERVAGHRVEIQGIGRFHLASLQL